MKKGIDDSIIRYITARMQKNKSDYADVQRLLDECRVALDLSVVYVLESMTSEDGFVFTHVSADTPEHNYLGFRNPVSRNAFQATLGAFDSDWLLETVGMNSNPMYDCAILCYKEADENVFYGTVGFMDFNNKDRVWGSVERDAIQKVGRAIHSVIEADYYKNVLSKVNEQGQRIREQLDVITALSRDCMDIFRIDLEKDESTSLKVQGWIVPLEKRVTRSYREAWQYYLSNFVVDEERERVSMEIIPEHIANQLKDKDEYAFTMKINLNDQIHDIRVQFVRVNEGDSQIIAGFRIIDDEVSAEKEKNAILRRHQEALEDALMAAGSANKAKTDFLFNMSHDIRTPMNAIIGFTRLIEKYGDDAERRKDYLQKIKGSSNYLLELINNVLEMARIESGKTVIEEVLCDTDDFLKMLASFFEDQIEHKNIKLIKSYNIKHRLVYHDPTKATEIFANVLSNAIKYTPEGGTIEVKVDEIESSNEDFAVYKTIITDNGIGMSKEFLPHIFEEFSRAGNTTQSKIAGTGLGMPITKRLVELMGGSIEVESELGRGTTFCIILPHRIPSSEEIRRNGQEAIRYSSDQFIGKHILLAEDNDLNAEITQEVLGDVGIVVERAVDGAGCIEMLKNAEIGYYNAILMDIQMPNINGYEAAARIRAMKDERSKTPIIAFTANAFEEDKIKAIEVGMNDHVGKPIDVPELLLKLAQLWKTDGNSEK